MNTQKSLAFLYTNKEKSEREIKKPLDESERGELKCWLKAQHSEN